MIYSGLKKKELPLVVVEALEQLFKDCRKIARLNFRLINIGFFENFEVRFTDKEGSKFFFSISNPMSTERGPSCTINYFPQTHALLKQYSRNIEIHDVKLALENWLNILRSYERYNLNEEDEFLQQSENEYYEEYKIDEVDADDAPFEDVRLLKVHDILTQIEIKLLEEKELEQDGNRKDKIAGIIKETRELKSNIQNLTKNETIRGVANIYAKIKQFSIGLLKAVRDVATKEAIKAALHQAGDAVTNYIHSGHF